jgi:hypothetical protein
MRGFFFLDAKLSPVLGLPESYQFGSSKRKVGLVSG